MSAAAVWSDGYSSSAAARYQHVMADRDAAIAAALDELVEAAAALTETLSPAPSGTRRHESRNPVAPSSDAEGRAALTCDVVVVELEGISTHNPCHAMQFRLLPRRWPLFLTGRRGPSWATSGCKHADQPARDGGQDRGERVRHRDPAVDERRPGDGPDDEVQAKGRHDREIQPIGEAAGAPR